MVAWSILQAMKAHPSFARLILGKSRIVQPEAFDLGIAVALEGDRLETGVISQASLLGWPEFATRYNRAVSAAREGKGGSKAYVPLIVTSMGALGVQFGMPIVVPPCMATFFVGSSHFNMMPGPNGEAVHEEVVTLSLTFDHRVANGAGAAAFIGDVKRRIDTFRLPG
jgi:pyruvate/2-oxoglutarate dehydrogenase complex dihydrolipoamide acyltransferase (E2) component